MTELEPLIKAFVKTLEEADIITTNTSDLTSTQFECFPAIDNNDSAHPRILGLLDSMKRRTVMQACEFKAYEFLSKDYMTFDASELPAGVIVNMSVWAFFKLDNPDMWVSNTGRFHTNEELAAILRDATGSIQVVDACDLH